MAVSLTCAHCNKLFDVIDCRKDTAKFCSRKCSDEFPRGGNKELCTQCGKSFKLKPYAKYKYARTLGTFCSISCSAIYKQSAYIGSKNPNYKSKNTDCDGYRLFTSSGPRTLGAAKHTKLHQAVAAEILGIERIPPGLHVHHRDCDINNCTPSNLVVLSASDHKWIHKQYGIATLWAFCSGKIGLDEIVLWSDDRDRAKRLLPLKVTDQINTQLL